MITPELLNKFVDVIYDEIKERFEDPFDLDLIAYDDRFTPEEREAVEALANFVEAIFRLAETRYELTKRERKYRYYW